MADPITTFELLNDGGGKLVLDGADVKVATPLSEGTITGRVRVVEERDIAIPVIATTAFGYLAQPDNTALLQYSAGSNVVEVYTAPAAYAGTYTYTPAILADLPYNAKAPVISVPSAVEGQPMTYVPGLWIADAAGNANIISELLRDGAVVTGTDPASYTTQNADAGKALTVRERDTVSGKTATSNAITVTAVSKTQTYLGGETKTTGGNSGVPVPFAFDFSAIPAGTLLIIGVSLRGSSSTAGTMTAAFGGQPCALRAQSDTTLSRCKEAFFSVVHPGGNPVFVLTTSGTVNSYSSIDVWTVTGTTGAVISSATFANASSASPKSLNLPVAADDLIFAIAGAEGASGATLAITGVGTTRRTGSVPTNLLTTQAHSLKAGAAASPLTVSATWTGSVVSAGLAISI